MLNEEFKLTLTLTGEEVRTVCDGLIELMQNPDTHAKAYVLWKSIAMNVMQNLPDREAINVQYQAASVHQGHDDGQRLYDLP